MFSSVEHWAVPTLWWVPLVEVLDPLSVLTDALSGEEGVTGSAVRSILKHVMDTCKPDDQDKPQMKSAIVSDLATRYNSTMVSALLAFWILGSRQIIS